MDTQRETVVVGNVFNFPIYNSNNDRVLGVFAVAFPLVVFLDTLFEKIEQKEDGGEEGDFEYSPGDEYQGGTPQLQHIPYPNPNQQHRPYPQTTPFVNPYQFAYSGQSPNAIPGKYPASPAYVNLIRNPSSFPSSEYQYKPAQRPNNGRFKSHFEDNTQGQQATGNSDPNTHYRFDHRRRAGFGHKPNQRQSQGSLRNADHRYDSATTRSYQRSPVHTSHYGASARTNRISRDAEHSPSPAIDKKTIGTGFVDGTSGDFYTQPQRKIELGSSRSITDDQASVYTQFANMMSTAGIDGSGCLQYIICELAQREASKAGVHDDAVVSKKEAKKESSLHPKKAPKGGSNNNKKKKKSRKSKSSLMADIVTTLLLPKQSQPLAQYVEAANTATGASCWEKYPGCPLGLSTVLNAILGHP